MWAEPCLGEGVTLPRASAQAHACTASLVNPSSMSTLTAAYIADAGFKDSEYAVEHAITNTLDALPLGQFRSKTRAAHSFVSFFLGTKAGNLVLLTIISLTLVLCGTMAWLAAGCGIETCDEYPRDFWSAWWLSWGVHFDPGTQTSIKAGENAPQKWVVVVFSILGFLLNLIFLGIIVEHMRILLDSLRRTHGRIIANDHTVILGWTDKTLFLLGELAEMMTDSQKKGGTIVVLGELDPLEMRMEVAIAFPDWRRRWRRVHVRYYRGKPYEVDDLLKVAVYSAERVIVLGCSRRPRVADAQILTTICALRCLPGKRFLTPKTNVIAELKQPQNEPVVRHIGGDIAPSAPLGVAADGSEDASLSHPLFLTPVVGNFATNAIMSLCALDPSAGLALLDLMNFSGDQIETISCKTFTQKGTTTFGVLRNSFNAATPLGVQEGERILLAPPDSHEIGPDTSLLVIAADIAAGVYRRALPAWHLTLRYMLTLCCFVCRCVCRFVCCYVCRCVCDCMHPLRCIRSTRVKQNGSGAQTTQA